MDETAESPADPSGPIAAAVAAGPRASPAAVDLAALRRLLASADAQPFACSIAAAAARSAVALATAGRLTTKAPPVTAAAWPPLRVRVSQAVFGAAAPTADTPGQDEPATSAPAPAAAEPAPYTDWADDFDDLLDARDTVDGTEAVPPMPAAGDAGPVPPPEDLATPPAPPRVPMRQADDDVVGHAAEAAHDLVAGATPSSAQSATTSREQAPRPIAGGGQGASAFALRPGDIYRHIPVIQPTPASRAPEIAHRSEAADRLESSAASPSPPSEQRGAVTPEPPAPDAVRRPTDQGVRAPMAASLAVAGDVAMEAPPPRTGTSPKTSAGRGWLQRIVKFAAYAVAGWLAVMLVVIAVFRVVDPPGSMLMLWRGLAGEDVEQRWVPLDKVSTNLIRAVIASEDARFCTHWGIDPREVAAAIERARDGVPRGASTISMQVAKNMFLWPSKSYLRKALEVPLTLMMEAIWGKRRILEVYLNVAEWGPGIYGAEAAARHHFRKPASRLSAREAALLAVALPNPIRRNAGDPGMGTARLARAIQARMRSVGRATQCVERSR